MSSTFPTKVFPGHRLNDNAVVFVENVDEVNRNNDGTTNVSSVTIHNANMTIDSVIIVYNGNNTDYTPTSYQNSSYYQHSSTSNSESDIIGIFLFTLGLTLCFTFLYLVAKRIHQVNNENDISRSNNGRRTTPSDSVEQQLESDDSTLSEKLFNAMSNKERRHYIDSVLNLKENRDDKKSASPMATSTTTTTIEDDDCCNIPVVIQQQSTLYINDVSEFVENLADVEATTSINQLTIDDFTKEQNMRSDDDIESVLDDENNSRCDCPPCCTICLEPFDSTDDVSCSIDPLCFHEYHVSCITEWLMKHPNCPYCRRYYIQLPQTSSDEESPPEAQLQQIQQEQQPPERENDQEQQQPRQRQRQPQHGRALLAHIHSIIGNLTNDWRHPYTISSAETSSPAISN